MKYWQNGPELNVISNLFESSFFRFIFLFLMYQDILRTTETCIKVCCSSWMLYHLDYVYPRFHFKPSLFITIAFLYKIVWRYILDIFFESTVMLTRLWRHLLQYCNSLSYFFLVDLAVSFLVVLGNFFFFCGRCLNCLIHGNSKQKFKNEIIPVFYLTITRLCNCSFLFVVGYLWLADWSTTTSKFCWRALISKSIIRYFYFHVNLYSVLIYSFHV